MTSGEAIRQSLSASSVKGSGAAFGDSQCETKMMRPTKLAAFALVTAFLMVTLGCEGEVQQPTQSEPPPPAEKTEKVPESVTDSVADEGEYERPEYPDSQRRNPFQPDPEVVEPQRATEGEGDVRSRDPLEEFGLGQLDLVAIISEVAVPKAMFIAPDGFGYVVKEGDRIGRNSGVVRDIRDNAVEVIEGGDDRDAQTLQRVIKLREVELSTGDDGLSDDERRVLERLLESEAGREALERRYQENAPGATAAERQETQTQTPPPSGQDPRFRGLRPPGGSN